MEQAMDMTLDEYIASFKAEKKASASSAQQCTKNNESKFKAEHRSNDKEVDDEDDDYGELKDDINAEENGIWRGPSANVNYIDLDAPPDDQFDAILNDDDALASKQKPKKNNTKNQVQLVRPEQNVDLRIKINGNKSSTLDLMPNSNSQQWRLIKPNVMSQRPAGMPPLVPQGAIQEDPRSQQKQNRRNPFRNRSNNRNGFYKNRNNNNNSNNNNGTGFNFNNGNGINFNNGNGFNLHNGTGFNFSNGNGNTSSIHNGTGFNFPNGIGNISAIHNARIQRFTDQQNYSQELLNKNIKAVLEQLNHKSANNALFMPAKKVHDLTIECPSNSINLSSDSSRISTLGLRPPPPANVRMTLPTQQTWQPAAESTSSSNSNDNLRSLLGINDTSALNNEMMPVLASKFLDFFQNCTQQTKHKPIYDMKVQKEIHELQKKPLLYKCPGGEVVSSDGVGINCEIIPRASGISLNHRFA